MGVKIVYSQLSRTDLLEIYNYIRRDSVFYAKREITLIKQAISDLKSNIFIGRRFEKLSDEFIRELIFKNYSVIYHISDDQQRIEVLTIHHHSRLLSNNTAFTNED